MSTDIDPALEAKHLPNIKQLARALHEMGSNPTEFLANLKSPSATPEAAPAPAPESGPRNAAVDRCIAAYNAAYIKRKAEGGDHYYWEKAGKAAYKRAMPPVAGPQNVADFIACVTRGIIEEVISGAEITQFLYAAQVANTVKNITTLSAPKRPRGRPSTAKTEHSEPGDADNSSVNTPSEN